MTDKSLATSTVRFDRPVSPKVKEAAEKLSVGIEAALNALDAPDAEELFDVVLVSAAAFFTIEPLSKQMRRLVLSRFDQILRQQRPSTVGEKDEGS